MENGMQAVMISVIIPVYNSASFLRHCLEAVGKSRYSHYECIVVNDGSTDESGEVAKSFPTRVVDVPDGPRGPAYARNRGAEVARGDILFFLDADVVLDRDTLQKVAETADQNPEIDAVFGSYDDRPAKMNFLSLYKNLFHHFVHQHAAERAVTFWSGCGAVRRKVFFEVGGFDEVRYPHPSIEDIELGYRLRIAGRKVMLDKRLQVQHLKRWKLQGMLATDIRDRAMPWTALILRDRMLPNDLNLRVSQRLCGLLIYVTLIYLGLIAFFHNVVLLPLLGALFLVVVGNWSDESPHFQMGPLAIGLTSGLIGVTAGLAWYWGTMRVVALLGFLVLVMLTDRWLPYSGRAWRRLVFGLVLLSLAGAVGSLLMSFSVRFALPFLLLLAPIIAINRAFYGFFARKQGVLFALAVIPFHLLYYAYSTAAFAAGVVFHIRAELRGRPTPSIRPLTKSEPVPSVPPAVANPAEPGLPRA
jgi:glycosyltransferase involved in cell wall biosynthesis